MKLLDIKGVGDSVEKKLNALGIYTPSDLVMFFPKSYIDMDIALSINECNNGDICFFSGTILEISSVYKKGKTTFFSVKVLCENTEIKIHFFNQPYYSKTLKIGEKYSFYGKIKTDKKSYSMANPKVDGDSGEKLKGIHPIYLTKGIIPQGTLHNLILECQKNYVEKSLISSVLEEKYHLFNFQEALINLHQPISCDVNYEKNRMTIERIVKRICAFRFVKNKNYSQKCKSYHQVDFSEILKKIPFSLSPSQEDSLIKLTKTLLDSKPLTSILCGDVGSGKTIVAVLLSYFVIKNGYQVAFMAPTALLAKQHFDYINSLFSPFGIKCAFLSGATKNKEKENVYSLSKSGNYDILVGTHSLLNSDLKLKNVGLIVTDEQHRFGVAQRTQLISKGEFVAVLTMSATPIPRSLRLVAYGEVDFLTIERERKSVVMTKIVPKEKREKMWEYIANVCQKGDQAYIVAPRIFDMEGIESESVEQIFNEFSKFLPKEKIGVLHGKLKPEKKQEILEKFYKNDISVLVSTTVIEVGINVQNATIMVICDAEKFGLATLHQLRGRIGRGDKNSYCFLYTENEPTEGLLTLVRCSSGIEIAEKDFTLRGSGDIFGLEQSGKSSLDGLTYDMLKLSSQIADDIDISAVEDLLQDEIRDFSLQSVSLN